MIFSPAPITPAAGDYQIMEVMSGIVEMASGVSDFYKGLGAATRDKQDCYRHPTNHRRIKIQHTIVHPEKSPEETSF